MRKKETIVIITRMDEECHINNESRLKCINIVIISMNI